MIIEESVITELGISDSIVKSVTKFDVNFIVESVAKVDANSIEYVVSVCMIF